MKVKLNRDYNNILRNLDILLDFLLNFLVGYLGYLVADLIFLSGTPIGPVRMIALVTVFCVLGSILNNYHNVYAPMRTQGPLFFVCRIFLVNVEIFSAAAILVILTVPEGNISFFIGWLLIANIISFTTISSKKIIMLAILHSLRIRKQNVKNILLVTDSQEMADEYLEEIFDRTVRSGRALSK